MKIINISGVIGWDVTAQDVREQLQRAAGDAVEAHMSSPGGLISVGLEIFNLFRDYNGPVTFVLKGYAMSMGSYIPLAAPLNRFAPGKVVAEDNAIYMIHNARGWVGGDHNEILGYGEALKGMSNMIAKAYARRTGKSLEDVTAMMDRTTYLFGDQIKEHGFADEILITDNSDSDEESARATAQAIYGDMMAKMTADEARMRADIQAVAQMLACSENNAATPPAAAGIINKEVQQMSVLTLAALLAANPAAQAEHNALLTQARAEGETAGTQRVEDRIKAAAPFLNNAKYPPSVGATALKVVTGEESQVSLSAAVAAVDAVLEMQAQTAATDATGKVGDTPPAPVAPVDPTAVVADDAGLEALKAQMKGGN